MKAFVVAIYSYICLALFTPGTWAADIAVGSFVPGKAPEVERLAYVEVKGLVAEFLDPGDTGLGKSVAHLLWREVLTAISDQAGAGVILAQPPDNRRLTDMLRNDYHRAAVEIARSQQARLVLWGVVNEVKEKIYIQNFLTLLPELIQDDLRLALQLGGRKEEGFSVEIPRTRYNFAGVETSRGQLFERVIIGRSSAFVHEQPSGRSPEMGRLAAGEALHSVDMDGEWFKVLFKDRTGWIESTQVDVPPRSIYADSRNINVFLKPADNTASRRVKLSGTYQVLDSEYIPNKGTRYRLDLPDGPGWIEAFLVEPLFSLPSVQFIAGLYRYQRKNFAEARKAFGTYIRQTAGDGEGANLAAAYQIYGASTLMSTRPSPDDFKRGTEAMGRAAVLTPFDPAVYNLRALARMAETLEAKEALDNLEEALKLDRYNSQSQRLLTSFAALIDPSNREYDFMRKWIRLTPKDKKRISDLIVNYPDKRIPSSPSKFNIKTQ